MRENYLSYKEIINYFGREQISDRYRYMYDKMSAYIHERGLEDQLYIHTGILQQLIMDYFTDIYRLNEFHKIEYTDAAKRLSYSAYWIIRRAPLQAAPDALNSHLVFANEGFVTTLFADELLGRYDGRILNRDEEEAFLEYLRHLNYHLKYRSVSRQDLELMLFAYHTGQKLAP